jgi:hypothetical protein
MRRQQGALVIQSNWRCAVKRSEFSALREAAIVMQGAWRCKHALSELRHLKSEAREASKLLEDKKVLEVKLKEVQSTLELVQGQRNELRQEVKDLKAALAGAKDTLDVSAAPVRRRCRCSAPSARRWGFLRVVGRVEGTGCRTGLCDGAPCVSPVLHGLWSMCRDVMMFAAAALSMVVCPFVC